MQILLDANLVGRYLNTIDPLNAEAVATIDFLVLRGHFLFYTPQVEAELCSFTTRPLNANGFGFTSSELDNFLSRLELSFPMLFPDETRMRNEFRSLRTELGATGKKVHDVRHVAACKALGVPPMITWNFRDFAAAETHGHIQVLQPALVIANSYPGL